MLDCDKYYIPTKFIYDNFLSKIKTISNYSDYQINGINIPVFKPIKNTTCMKARKQLFSGDERTYQQWLMSICDTSNELPKPLPPEPFKLSCLYLFIDKDKGGIGIMTWKKQGGIVKIGDNSFNCTYYPVSNWNDVFYLDRNKMIKEMKSMKEAQLQEYSVF